MTNPIKYLQDKGFRITSDPTKYDSGKWGLRQYYEIHNGKRVEHDAYCDGMHPAYDLSIKEGADLPAVVAGTIVAGTSKNGNFGGTVVLADHKGDYQYIYGHCKNLKVKVGDTVKQGQKLAEQSNTNYYNNPMASHLHFQIQVQKYYAQEKAFVCTGIDPLKIDVTKYKDAPKAQKVDKTRHLIIAGHGPQQNGTFDPGAIGFISEGEHRYVKDKLFPAMRKHLPKGANVTFYSDRKVSNYGNLRQIAKQYKAEQVTEIHYDAAAAASARGGHVIIHSAYSPDRYDIALRDAISAMVGTRFNFKGQAGISGRNNLYNVNDARNAGIAYRLIELGFGTNRTEADIMTKQVDEYARRLVNALVGTASNSGGTDPVPKAEAEKKAPAKQPTSGGWRKNKYNTQILAENGTATVRGTRVMSRAQGPFLSNKEGGWLYPGYQVKYSYILRQPKDKMVWIQYWQNGQWWFAPFNTWDPVSGKVGSNPWFTFK